jgi:hypothetical protein
MDLNATTNEWMRLGYTYMTLASNSAGVVTNVMPMVLMSDRFSASIQYHAGRSFSAADTDKGTIVLVSGGAVKKVSPK